MIGFVSEVPEGRSPEIVRVYLKGNKIYYARQRNNKTILQAVKFNNVSPDKPLRCSEVYRIFKNRSNNIPGLMMSLGNYPADLDLGVFYIDSDTPVPYSLGSRCFYGITMYKSLVSENKGHTPGQDDDTYWEPQDMTEDLKYYMVSGKAYSETTIYGEGDYCYTGELKVYRSLIDGNTDIPGAETTTTWIESPLQDDLYERFDYTRDGGYTGETIDPYLNLPVIKENVQFPGAMIFESVYDSEDLSERIRELEREYYELFGSMEANKNQEVSLYCSSYSETVDFINNTLTIDLISGESGKYTNSITLDEWRNKILGVPGIGCKVDLGVEYVKSDNIYMKDITFTAFKIEEENSIKDGQHIINVNEDVEVEYLGNRITARPKLNTISECIIKNCLITYGKF